MLLKLNYNGKSVKASLTDGDTFGDLLLMIEKTFNIPYYSIELMVGYPPINIEFTSNMLVGSVLNSGTTVTVKMNERIGSQLKTLVGFGYSELVAKRAMEVVKDGNIEALIDGCNAVSAQICQTIPAIDKKISKHDIPADNSCLFNAIGFLIEPQISLNPLKYREIVASTVVADETYSSDILGSSPEEYATWIMSPDKWGGEIEMNILALKLAIEICAVDIATGKMYVYGEGRSFKRRIYLLYDGVHYDAVVQTVGSSQKDIFTTFSPADTKVVNEVLELVDRLREDKQFTNLSGCTLQCKVCQAGFVGQKEAVEHAEITGHQNFGQV